MPEDDEAEEYIVYRVLDALTDALFPVIDDLERRIDALEEQVLQRHRPRTSSGQIYRLKQEVQMLLRRLVPQRDQFGGGDRGDHRRCPA